ncbi:hypothetical protein GCM10020218_012880 [Dactylosporangium vinaceum]
MIAPVLSMYGKQMRPGATVVSEMPWDEISGVSLDDAVLTVDLVFGEYIEVHASDEGYAEAVRELTRAGRLP